MAEKPQIRKEEILSDEKYVLKKVTYELNGESQTREVYERGNAATILLYNNEKGTVLLTRQFRLPSFLNGNKNGMLIEACQGYSMTMILRPAPGGKQKRKPVTDSVK